MTSLIEHTASISFKFLIPVILLSIHQLHLADSCPSQCQCVPKFMSCNNKGLLRIPDAPSVELEVVYISKQVFSETRLHKMALASYSSPESGGSVKLKILKIRYCNINSIERYAFARLGRQLEIIDLSGNPLHRLEGNAFSGLYLKSLYLNDLPAPSFDPAAFQGAKRIDTLSLQNSALKVLSHNLFDGLVKNNGLQNLHLKGNKLSTLPSSFYTIFRSLRSYEIIDNPWHCDCELKWLFSLYWSIGLGVTHRFSNLPTYTSLLLQGIWNESKPHPRCESPSELAGYYFVNSEYMNEISPKIMPPNKSPLYLLVCQPPLLRHIELDIRNMMLEGGQGKAVIGCHISASSKLDILWTHKRTGKWHYNVSHYANSVNSLVTTDPSEVFPSSTTRWRSNEVILTKSQLVVSQVFDYDIYTCYGENSFGNTSTTIKINWPFKHLPLITSPVTTVGVTTGENIPYANPSDTFLRNPSGYDSIVLAKRFSLIDIIGAVLGTFLITILFFILTCRFRKVVLSLGSKVHYKICSHDTEIINGLEHSPDTTSYTAPFSLKRCFNCSDAHASERYLECPSKATNGILAKQEVYTTMSPLNRLQSWAEPPKGLNRHSSWSAATTHANRAISYDAVYGEGNHLVYDIPNDQYFFTKQPSQSPFLTSNLANQAMSPRVRHSLYFSQLPPPPGDPQPVVPLSSSAQISQHCSRVKVGAFSPLLYRQRPNTVAQRIKPVNTE